MFCDDDDDVCFGNEMQVNWQAGAGSITINGTRFSLQGAHWHWPSEHLIDGKRSHPTRSLSYSIFLIQPNLSPNT